MAGAAKDKVEGKFHEVKGAVTGNAGEELKGKAQGAKGKLEHAAERGQREAIKEQGRIEGRREVGGR